MAQEGQNGMTTEATALSAGAAKVTRVTRQGGHLVIAAARDGKGSDETPARVPRQA